MSTKSTPITTRVWLALALPAFLLVAVAPPSPAAAQTTTSGASTPGRGATSTQPADVTNTANSVNTGRVDAGSRGTAASNAAGTAPQRAITSTIRSDDLATADGSTAPTSTLAQQQALRLSLASMQSRLDNLVASMNSASGAQRTEAMAGVIQEMASQLAEMRQLLLASGQTTTAGAQADQPAIFITPSSAAQAEVRRRGELGEPVVDTDAAAVTNRGTLQPGTSGMAAQGESRRRGESTDATSPDGD